MATMQFLIFQQSIVKTYREFTKFYFLSFWNVVADIVAPATDEAMNLLKSGMISLEYLVIIYQERFQSAFIQLSDWPFWSTNHVRQLWNLSAVIAAGTPRMFQTMMLCGRQIIDLYQKHAISLMEYKWEIVKDDAEAGFQIDAFSRLWLVESEIGWTSIWKLLKGIIETNEEKC